MSVLRLPLICLAACALAACGTTSFHGEGAPGRGAYAASAPAGPGSGLGGALQLESSPSRPRWRERQSVLQGHLGVTMIDDFDRTGGQTPDVDGSEIDTLPVLGGGAQLKLGGGAIDWGVEGLFALDWRSNGRAFAVGGGGAAVAIDVDLLLLELYGGPFASAFLGSDWRVYAGAGPLVHFADYEQRGPLVDDHASGFGVGTYVRAGLEYRWTRDAMVGIGARYFDSRIDLNSGLGDIDLTGTQYYVTMTRGF